jgi:hypothetical protein
MNMGTIKTSLLVVLALTMGNSFALAGGGVTPGGASGSSNSSTNCTPQNPCGVVPSSSSQQPSNTVATPQAPNCSEDGRKVSNVCRVDVPVLFGYQTVGSSLEITATLHYRNDCPCRVYTIASFYDASFREVTNKDHNYSFAPMPNGWSQYIKFTLEPAQWRAATQYTLSANYFDGEAYPSPGTKMTSFPIALPPAPAAPPQQELPKALQKGLKPSMIKRP